MKKGESSFVYILCFTFENITQTSVTYYTQETTKMNIEGDYNTMCFCIFVLNIKTNSWVSCYYSVSFMYLYLKQSYSFSIGEIIRLIYSNNY